MCASGRDVTLEAGHSANDTGATGGSVVSVPRLLAIGSESEGLRFSGRGLEELVRDLRMAVLVTVSSSRAAISS